MEPIYVYNDELYHHGILGMKWGVRRYQNPDGSLTEKGKIRYSKVKNSNRLQKRDTRLALKILKKNTKFYESVGAYNNGKSRRHMYKLEKSEIQGKNKKADKYAKAVAQDLAGEFLARKRIELNNELVYNIKSGHIKAGKDFIIQTDYDVYPLPGITSVRRTRTFIAKDPKILDINNDTNLRETAEGKRK